MSNRKPKRVLSSIRGTAEMPKGFRGTTGHRYHPTKGFRAEKGFTPKRRRFLNPMGHSL